MSKLATRTQLADLAEQAARKAGAGLLARFRQAPSGVSSKASPTDLVSDADREADRTIVATIHAARPQDIFLTEESGDIAGDGGVTEDVAKWVVDPLDGTVNFLYGIAHWAVSIAAEVGGETVAGVVFNPTSGEMFRAVRGGGATVNGVPLHVTKETQFDRALLGTGFYYDSETRQAQVQVAAQLVPRCRDIRRAGAASLDLAAVAAGRLDGYYEAPLGGPWDWAAGELIVTEAGGTVRSFASPWGAVPGVFAAGNGLIDQLESAVRDLLPR